MGVIAMDSNSTRATSVSAIGKDSVLGDIARLIAAAPAGSELAQRAASGGLDTASGNLDEAALAQMPTLRKGDLAARQSAPGGLAALLPFGGTAAAQRIYRSPGGALDFEGQGPDYWGFAAYVRGAGIGAGDIAVVALSFQGTPGAFMFDEGLRAAGASVVPAGTMGSDDLLAIIGASAATVFVGIPSHLVTLLRKAEDSGQQAATQHLRHALLAGEKLTPEVRAILSERGITAWQAYGTAELGLIAAECPQHDVMHLRADLHAQICDPDSGAPVEDGKVGEVVVSLSRQLYPMVRLATGDLSAFAPGDRCACGYHGASLVGVLGRTDALTKVRGMFIHPRDVSAASESLGLADQLRVVVEHKDGADHVTLLVAPSARGTDLAVVEAAFRKHCALRAVAAMGLPSDFIPGFALIADKR